jgi:hypothetical protein
VILLGLALALHVALPLLRDVRFLSTLAGVGYILVLGYAGWLTIEHAHARRLYAGALLISAATTTVMTFGDAELPRVAWLAAHAGFFTFITGRVIAWSVSREHVDVDTIFAALSGYYLMGLSWALAYALLDLLAPSSFTTPLDSPFDEALYFSFVTLTTLGYGDIAPVAALSRALATTEALVGQVYLAVLIARLVSQYIAAHADHER